MEDQLSSPNSDHHNQNLLEQNTLKDPKKLALIPLVFLIFFEVSGGAYGEESTVGAAGPLWAILGFIIFPFIWSIPEALLTAELATAFPGNGGFVIWANHAFGPFWGSLMGSWKYLTGVLNMASYPVLCIDYIKLLFPIFDSGVPRYAAIFVSTLVLSFLNYSGLAIVGYTAVTLGVLALSPFLVLTLFSVPKIVPSRWISLGQNGVKKNWPLYFNTLFWNLNFWDNASTLAGEVENPQKTYPKALFSSGLLAILGYLVPLLAATGAVALNQEDWTDGYFADLAEIIAGKWLKYWMEIGACSSVIGLYEAQLSSVAYQLLGMANMGFVPPLFGVKSKWFGTPWIAILVSTLIALISGYMDFDDIISSANFMYSLSMLLEFASFLWLRIKMPALKRPFRVPMGLPGLIIMCLIPSGFLIYVMTVATTGVLMVSAILTVVGICWYFLMKLCKSKMWIQFNNLGEELEFEA